jgi:septal ring factor EnvC (AmiA/AmiB activator)
VNGNGKLGTMTSSERFKDEIKPMDKASEAILALRPVSFRYKKNIDPQGIPQFGLVAEEVEKVNPDLVIRDAKGNLQTVRYEQINAMLLNEFLKEHKAFLEEQQKVQQLEAKITRQQKDSEANDAKQRDRIQALAARLDEQAGQIQRVSAQIEVCKFATGRIRGGGPAPQTIANSR